MPRSPLDPEPSDRERPPRWFVFREDRLLVARDGAGVRLPDAGELERIGFSPSLRYELGDAGGREAVAAEWAPEADVDGDLAFAPLRSLFGALDDRLVMTAGLGGQLLRWDRSHRFCGKCGEKTEDKPDERAKLCPMCGLTNYPRLSPAVIVAVVRGDRILLARNKRFKRPFYSVLAGFVEPGETLEQCVEREVFEETGISVSRIRYFGSQPWPFPDSLMVGFLADYAGGEVRTDGLEIGEAGWFPRDDLPPVPPPLSIARRLIDSFVNGAGE